MRPAGVLVLAVLAGAALLAAPSSMAEAQRGRDRGMGLGRDRMPAPTEQLGPGEYSLGFERVLEAVDRGEGRQALAYYERVAVQAEQQGDRRRAGQASLAVGLVTLRLGLYQKTIQSGSHAIELLKSLNETSAEMTSLVTTAYLNVGSACRLAGDRPQARKMFEEGLAYAEAHGELNESDPLSSALLLVPGGGEDGRLEVRELFGLDLHARLVFLSACETGLGKLSRGDELVGLQRAFLYAGTPAVITTLWKVEDRTSYELVRAFYSHLDSAGMVESLRQAQLETLRTFPHPFAWAAFGLTGVPG